MATPHTAAPHVTVSQTNKEATINNQADAMDNSFNDVVELSPGATGGTITEATFRSAFAFRAQDGTASANDWQFAIPSSIKKHFCVINETGFDAELGFVDAASDVFVVEAYSFGIFYTDGVRINQVTGGFQGATLEVASEGTIVRPNAFGIDFTGNLIASVSEVSDGRVEVNVSTELDIGGNYPIQINPKFVGALKTITSSYNPSGTGAFEDVTFDAAASDPYGFDGTNQFVIPSGVTKVQIRGNVIPDAHTDNQFRIQKNGTSLTSAEGRVSVEVNETAYTNGGESFVSGVFDVTAGDTITLQIFVSSTAPNWEGWMQIEAVEHTKFDVGVGSIQVTEELGTSLLITDDMLDGFTYIELNNASPITVTVPGGLISRGPVVFEQTGAGAVTFDFESGVELHSYNNLLSMAGQHSVVTVMPKGADVYTLFGNLA